MLDNKKKLWNARCLLLLLAIAICLPVLSQAQCRPHIPSAHIVTSISGASFAVSTKGAVDRGDLVSLWPEDASDSKQRWNFNLVPNTPVPPGCVYTIDSVAVPGKRLDCNNGCTQGMHPQLWDQNTRLEQQWLVRPDPSGPATFWGKAGTIKFVLDSDPNGPTNPRRPQMWPPNRSPAQLWTIFQE
jgi:hypothetical protein